MTPIPGLCVVCRAPLTLPTEAVRCAACQDANRWPPVDDAATLRALVVATPRHRVGRVCRDGVWVTA